jgi:FkbM family methyltransferase
MIRFPTLENTLRFLVAAGIEIGTVLDVGVHTGSAALQKVLMHKKHILFEPVSECYEKLEKNYTDIEHELIKAAISDYDGVGFLQKYSIDESEELFCNLTNKAGMAGASEVPALRLDSFCQCRSEAKPYLLKIAVDGHERPVLRGAQAMLKDVAVLVIDAGPSNLLDHMNFMGSRGFQLFDIVDLTYYCGVLYRMDLVFLANGLADGLGPRPGPVAWDQWVPVTEFDPNRLPTDREDDTGRCPADADEWLPLLHMSLAGERVVRTKPGQAGRVFYGPYRHLPAGRYRARVRLKLSVQRVRRGVKRLRLPVQTLPLRRKLSGGGTRGGDATGQEPVALLDVTSSNGTVCLARRPLSPANLGENEHVLDFAVSEAMADARETVEIRMWSGGSVTAEISSVTVEPIAPMAGADILA